MKKFITLSLTLSILFSLVPVNTNAQELSERLKGKILLQVQDAGQAWYVDPATKERAFLGHPADAFRIMRELGLGVSEKDYNTFDEYAPVRLSGRILLRVEARGEAYYVNPTDLKMHYLGRPADAFRVMREQGLGITNQDLNKVPIFQKYKEQVDENTEAITSLTDTIAALEQKVAELEGKLDETSSTSNTDSEDPQDDSPPSEPEPQPSPSPSPSPSPEPEPQPDIQSVAALDVYSESENLPADSISKLNIYAAAKDHNNNYIADKIIKFILPNTVTIESRTNSQGIAIHQYVSSGIEGIKTIYVSADGITENIQIEEINYPKVLEFDIRPTNSGISFGIKVDRDYMYELNVLKDGVIQLSRSSDYYLDANIRIGTGLGNSSNEYLNPATDYSYMVKIIDRNGQTTIKDGPFTTLP